MRAYNLVRDTKEQKDNYSTVDGHPQDKVQVGRQEMGKRFKNGEKLGKAYNKCLSCVPKYVQELTRQKEKKQHV